MNRINPDEVVFICTLVLGAATFAADLLGLLTL